MKKAQIRFVVLTVVFVALSFLLLSCKITEKLESSTETVESNSSKTILYEATAFGTYVSRNNNENVDIRHQKDFIELSRDTLERINEILYADYGASEEAKKGVHKTYVLNSEDGFIANRSYILDKEAKAEAYPPLFFGSVDETKVYLGDELTEKLVAIVKRVSYDFECIYAAKDRITYVFGGGAWRFICTLNGKPPTYYSEEGDRNRLFPREESLGGNWYYVAG